MRVYAVRSNEEDILEVYNSFETAINEGISLIKEYADKYCDEDTDIEEIIEAFKKYEYVNMLDFDISIYHLTLNE